jgi:hypothetical protein
VQDDGGTAAGGTDTDAIARTMSVNVLAAAGGGEATPPAPTPPAPPPPDPVAAPVPPTPTPPALTQQIQRAADTARTLLASVDVVLATDAGDGLIVPAVAEQPLVRNPIFASAQRLATAVAVPTAFLAPPAAAPEAVEAPALDQVFSLVTVSDTSPAASAASRSQGLANDLNQIRDEMAEQAQLEHWVSASVAVGTFGLTVGYVLWLLRGGALLTSLLSTLPAWRLIDPLPVLGRVDDEEPGAGDDDDDAFAAFLDGPPAKPS